MSKARNFSEIAPNIAFPEFNLYVFATFETDSEERRVRSEGQQHIGQRDIVHGEVVSWDSHLNTLILCAINRNIENESGYET